MSGVVIDRYGKSFLIAKGNQKICPNATLHFSEKAEST
jgi:hypothetical protein